MFIKARNFIGRTIRAEDGRIGHCRDFLFDETMWTIRYLIADTGGWLPGRKVLLSPISIDLPDPVTGDLPVQLSRAQIEKAPELPLEAPVSQQYESRYHTYYGWPFYWRGPYTWGVHSYPRSLRDLPAKNGMSDAEGASADLHSVAEVIGYRIHSTDGEFGRVKDFIVEMETWMIRYLIVDTSRWLRCYLVLIAPQWVSEVDWLSECISLEMEKDRIRHAPAYDAEVRIDRKYEKRLYDYFEKSRYWEKGA